MLRKILNVIGYQVAWFACVLSAAAHASWIGTLIACCIVMTHLAFAGHKMQELKLAAFAVCIGLLVDSALLNIGVVAFNDGMTSPYVAPHWMLALWLAFATTLSSSLAWLIAKPSWSAIFGAIGGPIAYVAGDKLGAITLTQWTLAIPAISVAWGLAMSMLSIATLYIVHTETLAERAA